MKKMKLGPLDVIHRPAAGTSKAAVFLLHGYGADQSDLAPLGQFLDREGEYDWYFPNAPMELPAFPMLMGGRAWFPIDMEALAQAQASGSHRSFAELDPEGFSEAATLVNEMLEALPRPKSEIILGGFSQGAMISAEVAFGNAEKFKSLCLLSGNPVSQKRWEAHLESHHKESPLRIFQSHGTVDAVLSFKYAQDLSDMLKEKKQDIVFHPFQGGHEIPLPILEDLKAWMAKS